MFLALGIMMNLIMIQSGLQKGIQQIYNPNQVMNNEIYKNLMPPRQKKRVTSFKKYYVNSFNTLQSSPTKTGRPFLDQSLLELIQKIYPERINRQIQKRFSISKRIKDKQSSTIERPDKIQFFSRVYTKMGKLSLDKMESKDKSMQKMRKRSVDRVKRDKSFFNSKESILWIQKKFKNDDRRGRYSQKLHPVCHIYEQCVNNFSRHRLQTENPFGQYEPIDF